MNNVRALRPRRVVPLRTYHRSTTPLEGLRVDTSPTRDQTQVLWEWRALMRANGLAENTIHNYWWALQRLLEHAGEQAGCRAVLPLEVSASQVAAFLVSLNDHSAAKEHYAKGIRSFYSFCCRRRLIADSPCEEIRPKRVRRPPAVRFEPEEVTRILIAAANRSPRRAWAILACLNLGCRRGEFVQIRCSDIDWERRTVLLKETKGGWPRTVDMNDHAFEACRELLKWSDGDRLVVIQPNTVNSWVQQALKDAELEREVSGRRRTAHTLRSTFVSTLLEEGAPPQVVQQLVGHQSLATTTAYAAVGKRHTGKEAVALLAATL